MRSRLLAFAVLLACETTGTTVPPAATEPTPPAPQAAPASTEPVVLQGFIVLSAGAVLTNAAGESVMLPASEDVWGYAVRLVSATEETLTVATYTEPMGHCATALGWYAGADVRFTARRADLLTVLTQEIAAVYSDGTSLRLLPGSIVRHDAPRPTVEAGGLRLAVELSAGDLGLSYQPLEAFEQFPPKGDVDARVPLVLDGRPLENVGALYPALSEANRYAMYDVEPHGEEGATVLMRGRCAELKLAVPATAVAERDVGGLMGNELGEGALGGLEGATPLRVLAADTPLTWTDGSAAGTVVRPLMLSVDDSVDPVCFSPPQAPAGVKAPKVCAPQSAWKPMAG